MSTIVTVTYEDGRQDAIRLLPIALVQAERHFKGSIPRIEGTAYSAWATLKPGSSFEAWLESIVEIDERFEESPGPSDAGAPPAS